MRFDITSLGDSLFLQNIFNGLAMITGTNDFKMACVIGALFGVILLSVQSVLTGKTFNMSQFVICLTVWFFFFGQGARVHLHDIYGGEDRDIDNVPFGVAFSGWAISSLGQGLTSLMEQGYQSVTSTSTLTGDNKPLEGRVTSAMKLLNKVSTMKSTSGLLQALNEDAGGKAADFRRTFVDYVSKCTFTKMQMPSEFGGATFDDIFHQSAAGPESSLKFKSNVYYAGVWTSGGVTSQTCTDAWATINSWITDALAKPNGNFNKALTGYLQPRESFSPNGATAATAAKDPITLTGNSWNSLLNNQQNNVANLLMAGFYSDMFYDGMARGYQDVNDSATATMIYQAKQQRNVQWAGESSMFVNTMRPMITFIEGFTYAIMPFAGIMLMTGMFGINLITKYLLLIAWVESWLPIMAIVNGYLSFAMQRALLEMTGNAATSLLSVSPSSFSGLTKIADSTATYLATGGMFMAAVPLLTLFLFTGSMFMLNSLTGRMAGSDVLNEKIAAPDVVQPAAWLARKPMVEGNGSMFNATADSPMMLNLSQMASNSVNEAASAAATARSQFAANVDLGGSLTYDAAGSSAYSARLNKVWDSSTDQTRSTAIQEVQKFAEAHKVSVSDSLAAEIAKGMQAGGSIGGSIGILQGKAGFTAGLSSKEMNQLQQLQDSTSEKDKSWTLSGNTQVGFKDGLQAASAHDESFAKSIAKKGVDTATVQRSAAKALEASRNYSIAKSRQTQFTGQQSISSLQLASLADQNPNAARLLQGQFDEAAMSDPTLAQEASKLEKLYSSDDQLNSSNAHSRAMIEALANRGKTGSILDVYREARGLGADLQTPTNNTGINAGDLAFNNAMLNANAAQAQAMHDAGVSAAQGAPRSDWDVTNAGIGFANRVQDNWQKTKERPKQEYVQRNYDDAQKTLPNLKTALNAIPNSTIEDLEAVHSTSSFYDQATAALGVQHMPDGDYRTERDIDPVYSQYRSDVLMRLTGSRMAPPDGITGEIADYLAWKSIHDAAPAPGVEEWTTGTYLFPKVNRYTDKVRDYTDNHLQEAETRLREHLKGSGIGDQNDVNNAMTLFETYGKDSGKTMYQNHDIGISFNVNEVAKQLIKVVDANDAYKAQKWGKN